MDVTVRASSADPSFSGDFRRLRPRILILKPLDAAVRAISGRVSSHMRLPLVAVTFLAVHAGILAAVTLAEGESVVAIGLPLLLASATTVGVMVVSAKLFNHTEEVLKVLFDPVLAGSAAEKRLRPWLDRVADTRPQHLCAWGGAAAAVGLTAYLDSLPVAPFPIHWSTYLAMGTAAWVLGGAAYWTLAIPTSARIVESFSADDIGIYKLDPAQTPVLKAYAGLFRLYALSGGAMATLVMLTIVALRPQWGWDTTGLLAIILVAGYMMITYVFLYPQLVLRRLIHREKWIAVSNALLGAEAR